MALDYDPAFKKGNYPGFSSTKPLAVPGIEETVSRIVGRRLTPAPRTMHGHCRVALRTDKGVTGVHIDPCAWSGILYLTLPQHCKGGTDFFRHRPTGLDRIPSDAMTLASAGFGAIDEAVEKIVNNDTNKPARWEKYFPAPMRFNRLILFSPWMFHNSASGFGDQPSNGRLIQTLFFAAA